MAASAACRCARKGGADSAARQCWNEFDRMLAPYPHSTAASACIPLSTELVCFEDPDDPGEPFGRCFVKDRGGVACDAEEARILEALWAAGGQDEERNARLDKARQAFIRDEKVDVPSGSAEGCSG
jgi:hypothetical protein